MLIVPEILCHGQRAMADPEATAGRFIHLTENHHHVRQHSSCLHVVVQLLTLAASLADAAEDTDAVVMSDHVMNHLGQEHGLANTGAAEESGFAAALERH